MVEDSFLELVGASTGVIEVSASFFANHGNVSVSGSVLRMGTGAGGIKIRAGSNSKTTAKLNSFEEGGGPADPNDVEIEGTNCKSIDNTPDVLCS